MDSMGNRRMGPRSPQPTADRHVAAASSPPPFPSPPPSRSHLSTFRPGIAVIVGVLTTLFSLTFLLLLYAKHCRRTANTPYRTGPGRFPSASSAQHRNSGVDRGVVESLPVFRFGALVGQKDGLECAVCLSRFDLAELLRLLPRCKHAFHVECVDTWLDAHSSCPLCRCRVNPEDIFLVSFDHHYHPDPLPKTEQEEEGPEASQGCGFMLASRISGRHSSAGERSTQKSNNPAQQRSDHPVMRKSVDEVVLLRAAGLVRRKDLLLLTVAELDQAASEKENRFEHRIIVSTSEEQERWSDLKPSDMLFLRSELILTERSGRPSAASRGRASSGESAGGSRAVDRLRCASEISGVSRYGRRGEREEERTMQRWLGFAPRRTGSAQWWPGSRGADPNGPTT